MTGTKNVCLAVTAIVVVLCGATSVGADGPDSDGGTTVAHGAAVGSVGDSNGRSGPWVTVTPNPVGVSRPAGVFVNGHFLVIGGEASGGLRDGFVQEYDPVADSWDNTNATMPVGFSNHCAAVVGSDVYVPGGYDGTYRTELQVYHQDLDSWDTITTDPVPYGPSGAACAEVGGKVYVFGGNTTGGYVDSAYVYDPAAAPGSRWTALTSAPVVAGYGDAVGALGGIFYSGLYSSSGELADVHRYDPVTDSWTTYPSLGTARAGARLWVHEGNLAVGGGGWSSYLNSVEQYDLSAGPSGTWVTGNPINTGRRTFAAAQDEVNGFLYAGAGWAGIYLANAERSSYVPDNPNLFPVNSDTWSVSGYPYWWNVGDTVYGIRNPSVGAVIHADVALKLSYNILNDGWGGFVDLDFEINGVPVGSFHVTEEHGLGYLFGSFDFAAVAPPFELRYTETNTVVSNAGSISLDDVGKSWVTFSTGSISSFLFYDGFESADTTRWTSTTP